MASIVSFDSLQLHCLPPDSAALSQALAKLADKIAALKQTPGSGVFDQIKNMIQKMIFHLMAEQKDEDDHKNWCDKEISTTTMMIEDKETKRDTLQVQRFHFRKFRICVCQKEAGFS